MNLKRTIKPNTLRILIASGVSLFALSLQAKTWEKSYDFEQSTNSVHSLNVTLRDADLRVSGNSTASTITVNVIHKVSGGTEEEAQEYFENEAVVATLNQSTFEVKNAVRKPKWNLFTNYHQHQSTVTIVCPVEMAAKLQTSDGDLTLNHLNGSIKLVTSDGDIEVTNVSGKMNLITSDGDVDIRKMEGLLEARTSDGDITIDELTGSIQAKTSDGDIEVNFDSNPTQDCDLQTSDGDVKLYLGSATSLLINARVSDGNIHNSLSNSTTLFKKRYKQEIRVGDGKPTVTIQTSDGDISLKSQ